MSIEPKEPCGTCGGKPVLTMCDRDGKTADIIGGWCRQCGRLGPMRAEVDEACAAWDVDQARNGESVAEVVSTNNGRLFIDAGDVRFSLFKDGDRVLVVRKGVKS
jgi:hypothetical protein